MNYFSFTEFELAYTDLSVFISFQLNIFPRIAGDA